MARKYHQGKFTPKNPKKHHQGKFTPKNPKKYKGDYTKIVYRSSWELNYFLKMDRNPNVIAWSSEEVVIPYKKPTTGKFHRYFMDVYMKFRDKNGIIKEAIVEIKPYDQTQQPKKPKRKTKKWEDKATTYIINVAKWKAAKIYAKKKGWQFSILTEKGMVNTDFL